MTKPSDEIQRLLMEVCEHFDKEDRFVRERQIRQWKKLKFYWNGFQRLWWSESAHDWRTEQQVSQGQNDDASFYDKPVNVFRAYLESIIAALSVSIPSIKCFPDDADNSLDLSTARAGDKIGELIYRHNDATLLWLHALYIYCTEGLIAAYNYTDKDDQYGSVEVPKYETENVTKTIQACPNCGSELLTDEQQNDEYDPTNVDVENLLKQMGPFCPQCESQVDPTITTKDEVVSRIVGVTHKPKARQCIEVYGGLFVKVPNYAMRQSDIPYLIFSYETHYANVISRYPSLKNSFGGPSKIGPDNSGVHDPYERWGRLSTQYFGEFPQNNTTVRNCWLRPTAYNVLNNQDDVDKLNKLYPDGAYVVLVNDLFAEVCNENLDDHWTLSRNPLSDYLHHDPLGLVLTSIQEITNDLVSLVLQTIEHGIPQTFASPKVLNFDQYKQTEATPGMIFPANAPSGGRIADGFYEVKTATLSQEVMPFGEKIQEMGQMVSGALPSLFGGAAPNSSKTAAQYAMSRAQALQRLQTPWKMLTFWWKDIFSKVIPAYIKDVIDDERIVKKDEMGNFINVVIRKAELAGKIGSVELEANENLPTTWSQRKDMVMQLFNLNNPAIMDALMDPENIPVLKEAIGLTDFNIPGDDDRQKQYEEIQQLINSTTIMGADGQENPSVEVEPMLDNHQIEADICRRWLVGDVGRLAKTENPEGYRNVLIHFQQHMQLASMMQQPPPEQQGGNNGNTGQPAPTPSE